MKYKDKTEFDSAAEYYEYLAVCSQCGNSTKLIAARLNRPVPWTVEKAVNTPIIKKPVKKHPYRKGPHKKSGR